MATLGAWQKITRVLPGRPFGDGANGAATLNADPCENNRATVTGTADSTSATAGSSPFNDGDVVMLHQTQGTGAGQWEINRVVSGGGTVNLVMQVALKYSYGTGAQIIKVPRYATVTLNAFSVTGWNGTIGGVDVLCAQSLSLGGAVNGSGLGFRGGAAGTAGVNAYKGESPSAASVNTTPRNPNGAGGGGSEVANPSGGAGGSHDGTGGTGGYNDQTVEPSSPSEGSFDVGKAFMGSGGGGGSYSAGGAGAGGNGGVIFIIFAKSLDLTGGTISSNGAAGGSGDRPGGGGAGGYQLFVCQKATLGTATSTATAGAAGSRNQSWSCYPTAGTAGRIAVQHSNTVTGTTNPTFDDTTDVTLIETGGAFLMNLL